MDALGKAVILALVGTLAAAALKKDRPDWGFLLTLSVSMVLLFFVASAMSGVFTFLENVLKAGQLSPQILTPVLKTTGITLVSRLAAEACRDARETAIAAGVEVTGVILSLYVAMPLVNAVLDMLQSFF